MTDCSTYSVFRRLTTSVLLALCFALTCDAEVEWSWRGPSGNGHAASTGAEKGTPEKWSESENVIWSAEVPGRGHSSPVLADGKIFLTTADEKKRNQSVLCYDLASGKQLWNTLCHEGVKFPKQHPKNTQASPTVAVMGDRAFAVFCNNDAVHVTCLGFDGKTVWQKEIGPWVPAQYQFGFGQSPIVHDGKLIVTAESEADPFVTALNPENGEPLWKIQRPRKTSYGTPVVANVDGREQLLMSGIQEVNSYDPQSGKELWTVDSKWQVACATMIWPPTEPIVYASGGFPAKQTLAIRADGSGEVLWDNNIKCYEQSLILVDDCLYGFSEGGILYCWDATTGEQLWRQRLEGPESASPVYVDGKLYFTNEKGKTWVVRPNRKSFDLVAENQLEEEMFASIAVSKNRLIMRVADRDGDRQERLYCIGQ